ncbi:hypothetical protein Belba_2461 [Belliella baltica DSM 15883]|uniref:DUF4136 domain-containing protein n=1 Tax=Belliella baltica (strain DSM 15883 / CIP 108006 / LMG 21964 / BA134) TaxID=866536 RepID=I3Z700_BELBD|nr:DUF4136 domain-containing protein [Belliella baltica]AFL85018.1 hypothetical protein Belba_2461 [Belliella baltica DSM 15883]
MHRSPTLVLLIVALLISSCSSIELFKERTEIRPYKEYTSFVIVNKEVGSKSFSDELIDARVTNELEVKMKALGLTYNSESPDLVIRYTSNEDPRQREVYNNQFPMWGMRVWDPWMYDPRFMGRQNMVNTKSYELLQLIVDFIDPKQDKMLMTITAVSEASSKKTKSKKLVKSADKVIQAYKSHMESN